MNQLLDRIKQERLKKILREKTLRIQEGEYERAAELRDKERAFIEENLWEQHPLQEREFPELELSHSGKDSSAKWLVRHVTTEGELMSIMQRMNLEYVDERAPLFYNERQIWAFLRIADDRDGSTVFRYLLTLNDLVVLQITDQTGDLHSLKKHEIALELTMKMGWTFDKSKFR